MAHTLFALHPSVSCSCRVKPTNRNLRIEIYKSWIRITSDHESGLPICGASMTRGIQCGCGQRNECGGVHCACQLPSVVACRVHMLRRSVAHSYMHRWLDAFSLMVCCVHVQKTKTLSTSLYSLSMYTRGVSPASSRQEVCGCVSFTSHAAQQPRDKWIPQGHPAQTAPL